MPDAVQPVPATWPKAALRALAAAGFVGAGANHFKNPEFYRQIIPPGFPAPRALVAISGACEIAGGLGLLIPSLRPAAGWGLIALLIAVFPANVYMAVAPERIRDFHVSRWLLWLRLPLQALLIAWVWYAARESGTKGKPNRNLWFALIATLLVFGCGHKQPADEIVVYVAVDEPYARPIFEQFEKETGLRVAAQYDIESSKSVGLAGKLEAESDHPRADVWWGSEAFLTTRLVEEGVLAPYRPPSAIDVLDSFRDADGYWTGVGLRARVLAVGTNPAPPFPVKSIQDLADPRLKDQVAIARPTAGSTASHVTALYLLWGPEKAATFFRKLHANGVVLLGGNAEVADQVGRGAFALGITDTDDVTNASAGGGKLSQVVPDQDTFGTLTMPTTVSLVKGSKHEALARKLVDYLASKQTEDRLIAMHFARYSVRSTAGAEGIKPMQIDYHAAARVFATAMRQATAILDGREEGK